MQTPFKVTYPRLVALLDYDTPTGRLSWRVPRGRKIRSGDEAGTVNKRGAVMVGIDGVMYSAARLAWFYVHKRWPEGRLLFRDGNPSNLAFRNLVEQEGYRSPSAAATYQRNLRELNRQTDDIILRDPQLLQRFNYSPRESKRVVREVRDMLRMQQSNTVRNTSRYQGTDQ